MARPCAISRSVAGCIARRRRRGEIWPPPQQQPFDALFPPDTGCCAARAPGIRSASPGSTIIRSRLVRSPKIRRKPFVQSSRRNEWVAPFVQYLVDDTQIWTGARPYCKMTRSQPPPHVYVPFKLCQSVTSHPPPLRKRSTRCPLCLHAKHQLQRL